MLYQSKLQEAIVFSDAFVLLKPDVFYRELLGQIIEFLKNHQLSIVRYLAGKVSEGHYRLMYGRDFCWNVDDWQHNRKLYTFGPALGLILRREKAGDILSLLRDLKGSALPKERKEDSLRRHFQSKSRIFNLVHVPDGPEQAALEASHWFGDSQYCRAPISDETIVKELALAGYYENNQSQIDPEEAFLIAKRRLLHALKNKGIVSEKLLELFHQAIRFYFHWSKHLASTTQHEGVEGTILPEWQAKERSLLDEMIPACLGDSGRVKALKVLADLPSCCQFPSNFFWILDEWDVYLSELEQYLIISRLKYNPVKHYHPSSEYHCL